MSAATRKEMFEWQIAVLVAAASVAGLKRFKYGFARSLGEASFPHSHVAALRRQGLLSGALFAGRSRVFLTDAGRAALRARRAVAAEVGAAMARKITGEREDAA